jgi:hypothetical protein
MEASRSTGRYITYVTDSNIGSRKLRYLFEKPPTMDLGGALLFIWEAPHGTTTQIEVITVLDYCRNACPWFSFSPLWRMIFAFFFLF